MMIYKICTVCRYYTHLYKYFSYMCYLPTDIYVCICVQLSMYIPKTQQISFHQCKSSRRPYDTSV